MPNRNRQSELNDNQLLLRIGPVAGIDATTDPIFIDQQSAPRNSHMVAMSNFVPNRTAGNLTTAKGRVNAFAANVPLVKVLAIQRFDTGTSSVYFVMGFDNTNLVKIYSAPLGGTWTLQYTSSFTSVPATSRGSFVVHQSSLYASFVDAANQGFNVKFDTTLAQTLWGISPYLGLFVPTAGGAGNLTGSYYWRFTYVSPTQESSPNSPSNVLTLSSQSANIPLAPSTDPQVQSINVYRLGGTLSSWLLVKSNEPNTSHTYVDNNADTTVQGQTLVVHRDVPDPFGAMEVWKERVWGISGVNNPLTPFLHSPSTVWYSNWNESTGFDNTNQVLPIAWNPGKYGASPPEDVGVALAAIGGMLLVFKVKGVYGIIGDSPQDFIVQQVLNTGCSGRLSVAKGGGLVFWLSGQGHFSFNGSSAPNYTSQNIKAVLDGLTTADAQAAVGFFNNQCAFLSLPTKNITYGLYLPTGEWFTLPYACDAVFYDPEQGEVTASEPNTGIIDSWFAAETDTGNPLNSSLTGKIETNDTPEFAKDYNYLIVEAPVQTGTVNVTLTLDPGRVGAPAPIIQTVDLSQGPRQQFSLPPTAVGTRAQLSLAMTSSAKTQISTISVYGTIKRQFVALGGG